MANLQQFISIIKTQGVASPNRYSVLITPPAKLQGYSASSLRSMSLLCQSVSLPGTNILTKSNVNFSGVVEAPYGQIFNDCNLSFILTNTMDAKYLFDAWQNMIVNFKTRVAGYYSDYVTDTIISVEDQLGNPQYTVKLFESYPKAVTSFQLDNDQHNSVLRLDVQLQYKTWQASNRVSTTDNTQALSSGVQTFPIPDPPKLVPIS